MFARGRYAQYQGRSDELYIRYAMTMRNRPLVMFNMMGCPRHDEEGGNKVPLQRRSWGSHPPFFPVGYPCPPPPRPDSYSSMSRCMCARTTRTHTPTHTHTHTHTHAQAAVVGRAATVSV